MIIDAESRKPVQLYHLMTQTLIPRPIAWVLSDNGEEAEGRYNLAPFSYFTPVSSNPPLLMFSVGKKPDGSLKDTRVNIASRGEFVVHIPSTSHADVVTQSSATLDYGVSEVEQLGLELVEFEGFSMPRLADCAVAYGCELYEMTEIGEVPQALIFGLVKQIYISDEVLQDNPEGRVQINTEKAAPLARLGAEGYWIDGQVISVPRPK